MCTSPIYPNIRRRLIPSYDSHRVITNMPLPCGKCPDCLKKRQSSYAIRAYKESVNCKSLHFITLTYDENTCPISSTLYKLDKNTGEISLASPCTIIPRNPKLNDDTTYSESRSKLNELPRTFDGRSFSEPVFEVEDILFYRVVADSLDYSDVIKLFKRFRRLWEYKYSEKPDFSYLSCGEYGKNTTRPHYHLLVWNLSDEQIEFLCSLWKYGFYLIKPVNRTSTDFLKVSQYVSKYLVKPADQIPQIVKDGNCIRPRVHSSLGLGVDSLTLPEIDYYRGYDLFGRYDIYHPHQLLTNEQIKIVAERISQRLVYYVNEIPFALPKTFLKRLFGLKFRNGLCFWSEIYVLACEITRVRLVDDDKRQYQEFCSANGLSETCLSSYSEFETYKSLLAQVRNKASLEKFNSFYFRDSF